MIRNLRSHLSLFLLLALSTTMFAAQRQCVIVDGFTQWNCGPCASWNPTERALLEGMTRDTVISLKTHGWWPGANNDAFHLWNVSETTARINYYGCNWVPWVMCDGSINISNVNVNTLRDGIRTRYSTPSPCTIDNVLAITASATTVQVTGTINAESNLTSNLYVALMRDLVTYASPPGSNGETEFPDAFADAAPNFNVGQSFTAAPGTPYNFNMTLNRDASWDVENLTVVVFIQNNATKEILQGTWAHVSQEYAFTTTNDDPVQVVGQPNAGEHTYLIALDNIGTENDTYTVTLSSENWPSGWTYSIAEVNGASDPNSINVSVNSFSGTFLAVRVNPNGLAGSAQFGIHTVSQGNSLVSSDHAWRLMAGLDVLVIDADGGETYETYYAEALAAADDNLNVVWGWWDASLDEVNPELFAGVDILIWFTGDLWQETLTPTDQLNLQDYLDAGGKLLLTGQGMGFDMRNDQFYTDYMHARYRRNFPIGVSATGLSGTAGSGLAFGLTSGSGANNQNRQTSLEARDAQATVIFTYDQMYQDTLQGAGLTVDNGTYRLMYFGFGFEAIADQQDRVDVMRQSLNWLLYGTVDADETPAALPAEFGLLQNYPNPFNPETNIPFALPVRSNVTLKVFDLLGREVATLADRPFEAGVHTVALNGSELSSGVYFYTLTANSGAQSFTSTRKLVLMK